MDSWSPPKPELPWITLRCRRSVNFADVLRLEGVGNDVIFKQNGTEVLTASDSSITSGSPGVTRAGNANIMFWEDAEAASQAVVRYSLVQLARDNLPQSRVKGPRTGGTVTRQKRS